MTDKSFPSLYVILLVVAIFVTESGLEAGVSILIQMYGDAVYQPRVVLSVWDVFLEGIVLRGVFWTIPYFAFYYLFFLGFSEKGRVLSFVGAANWVVYVLSIILYMPFFFENQKEFLHLELDPSWQSGWVYGSVIAWLSPYVLAAIFHRFIPAIVRSFNAIQPVGDDWDI